MNNSNLPLAIVLSIAILVGFQFLYVKPQQDAIRQQIETQKISKQVSAPTAAASPATVTLRDRAQALKDSPRLPIETPELKGSLNLKGARFDDLSLLRHKASAAPDSPSVVLLSPSGSAAPHKAAYAEFSWLSEDESVPVPTSQSVWRAEGRELSPASPVKLIWANGQGLVFEREISIDDKAMFAVTDRVRNAGKKSVNLYPFGLVARQGIPSDHDTSKVSHEGLLGVLNGVLEEHPYDKMKEQTRRASESEGGWLGIAAKYWLVALIPAPGEKLAASFSYSPGDPVATEADAGHYQTDFRGGAVTIEPGASIARETHFFAGPKNPRWLDGYRESLGIKNFDRAIDYGRVFWLPIFFLAKPFLYLLDWMSGMLGNIGLAILAFTVLLKLATLPLSLKSYHSMARMKTIQPEMKRLQERFADDKLRLNQEIMELYKRERVNPMSGCLPVLIQIPIFFALYAVLNVDIAMRQAPFYGWIRDMSMPDPTTIFNLFGMIPWNPPQALQIGAWPLIMGATMFLQQKLSPQPPDKTQARMFLFLPILFTYMFAHMPSGLVIYWTWSNLLSIAQQWFIMRKDAKEKKG